MRKRKLLTAAVFAGSMIALVLTVRESHYRGEVSDPEPPAQKLPLSNGKQYASLRFFGQDVA